MMHRALPLVFFFSGALALIYEVLWQRRFAFVFGAGGPATAAVLAAYFTGLGTGSRVLGGAAARWGRPLRTYAVLEVLIGAGALLVGPLSSGSEGIRAWLVAHVASSPGVSFGAMASLALLSLAVPTFCMGGTLPVLAEVADGGQRRLGINAGRLYAVNTAGAGLGALSVPLVLLPALGATGALWFCVAGNLILAWVAWGMDRQGAMHAASSPAATLTPRSSARGSSSSSTHSTIVLSLLSGLVTFVLQVLWNRAFAQVHENSVHSFALIVAVFVFALAIGAQLARWGLQRGVSPDRLIGAAWLSGGALAALGPWLFLRLTGGLAYLPSDGGWAHYALRLALLAVAVLLPTVTLIGVGLPALMEQAGRGTSGTASDVLGRLLAANVIGGVSGALIAGFLLPRWVGMWHGILVAAAVLVAAGAWSLGRDTTRAGARRLRLVAAAAGVLVLWPWLARHWPRVRISGGERLVALSEGAYGIVAVVDEPDSRRLKLNNHYLLGGTVSSGDERMQVHVPLLLHPSPRRVAVLGLGTGITAGGVLFHPFERLTVAELVPEVVAAAREYLREANGGVLDDPRTRVVVADARSHLRGTPGAFDVIVGDLVVPWRQGESALFTAEHFAATRRALAPGGLFCQWLPLFQLSEPELTVVLRTFLSVFPRAQVWRGDFSPDASAVALVGAVEPFTLEPAAVERRLRALRPDPLNPHLAEPMALWMSFVGVVEGKDLPLGDGRINREDHPWIELMGPLHHAGRGALLCRGRRLQAWLAEVKRRSAGRVPNLGAAETAGIDAGELLLEFSLSLSERDEPGARSAQARLQTLLPRETYATLFPPGEP